MNPEQAHSEHYATAHVAPAAPARPASSAPRASRALPAYERQGLWIAVVVGLGLLVAGVFLLVSDLRHEDLAVLTKDPVAAGGLDFETGIMTRIEVMLWIGAAAAGVTAGFIAQRLERPDALVLLSFGLLGLVMAVDDSLMIHEAVSSFIGLPLVELAYIAAIVLLVWRFRATILSQTPWLVLAAAIVGLGLSEAVDVLDDHLGLGAGAGVEDVFKFIGILLFAAYLLLMTRRTVAAVGPRRSP